MLSLDEARKKRERIVAEMRRMISAAEEDGRDFTTREESKYGRLEDALEQATEDVKRASFAHYGCEVHQGTLDPRPLIHGYLPTAGQAGGHGIPGWGVFSEEEIREALDAVRHGKPARVIGAIDSGSLPMSDQSQIRYDDISPILRDRLRVASLMPQVQVSSPHVVYFRATAAADAAEIVPAGSQKPESTPGWEEQSVDIVTLAHMTVVDRIVLQDWAGARDLISNEMIRGLVDRENELLLNGVAGPDGMDGLLALAGGTPITQQSMEPVAQCIHRALTSLEVNSFSSADAIVIHPVNLEQLRFERAEDGDGVYLAGDPWGVDPGQLWGVRVVTTSRIAEDTVLVGDFSTAARYYSREAPVLLFDPFTKLDYNQIRLVCETRLALAVPRPAHLVTVALNPS